MRRALCPAHLEAIANSPQVAARLGSDGTFRAGASWHRTVALEWDEGGVVFLREGPAVYSGHWVFLPKTKDVVGKGREALAYLFAHTDCLRVIGMTPQTNKAAIRAAKAVGMRVLHTRDGYVFSELTRAQWNTDQGR